MASHLTWNKTPNSHSTCSTLCRLSHLTSHLAPLCTPLQPFHWILSLAVPKAHPRPLLGVFALAVPSAWYAFPQQFMVHSITLLRSLLKCHLISKVFSVHLTKIP